jgi:L-ribulokinase
MQIYADITGLPLSTIGSAQGPALGSAIHAAVAAGKYADIRAAAAAMGSEPGGVYIPIPENVAAYEELFNEYRTLHDYFGRGTNSVMHRLKAIQRSARQSFSPAAAGSPQHNAVSAEPAAEEVSA